LRHIIEKNPIPERVSGGATQRKFATANDPGTAPGRLWSDFLLPLV
jgi:hypothetical protein